MLYFNGFGNIWENPKLHSANDSVINRISDIFELRLKDQYIQHFDMKCRESVYNRIKYMSEQYWLNDSLDRV